MGQGSGRRLRGRSGKFYLALVADLLGWAEWHFRQARPAADGASQADHLASAARQLAALPGRNRKPVMVDAGPLFPIEIDYLWAAFTELSAGLQANGFAPPMVTWEAIGAWQRLTEFGALEPWEARTLVQLGMVRAMVAAEQNPKPSATTNRGQKGWNRA